MEQNIREELFKRNVMVCIKKQHTFTISENLFVKSMLAKIRMQHFNIENVTTDHYNYIQRLANP